MKRMRVVLSVVAVAVVGAISWGVVAGRATSGESGAEKNEQILVQKQTKNASQKVRIKTKKNSASEVHVVKRAPKPVLELDDDDDDDNRTPEEKALAAQIEKALDDENFQLAVDCSKSALTCKNTEIRQAMVDTLGWFGAKALPELTPFMADPDEDVRESAQNEWSMALSDVENDAEKIETVEMAMQVLSDEDVLEDISGEYIGVDEKLAVESLLRIIEGNGGKEGIAKAKETYEFVTGEEFSNRAAAEKWLAEEYTPSELESD